MVHKTTTDADLLERFIATFDRLDDLVCFEGDAPPELLATERDLDDWNSIGWRPAKTKTSASALTAIRRTGPLPELYESLVMSYRWLAVDLGVCRLIANPPANDLQPLADSMYSDPVMNNTLLPAGFVRFALAANECYDPICFDLSRMVDGDCPIVRMNHESILMNDAVGEITTVSESFRKLVVAVIESVS